jgi:hypothetical protein
MLYFYFLILFSFITSAFGYDQPNTLNLGFTNILDGGPIRPTDGWYYYQYFQYYTSDKFLDRCGNCLGGVPSPRLNVVDGTTEIIYQSKPIEKLQAKLGFNLLIPYFFYSKTSKNSLGITDSGAGISDLIFGPYIQFLPIMKDERPIFVNRLVFWASFPTGKFCKAISLNPGNGFYYIAPHWSGTLFFTPSFATSWRLHYIWSSKGKTGIQAGQAILYDYSLEYEVIKDFWLSATGYYLKQFTDSKIDGIPTPGRREQVFSIGPGALYKPTKDLSLFGYVYFEKLARNRPQGINFIVRSVFHF